MLIDDYLEYQLKYNNKYGDKTVILMQVGSFFECYAIDNPMEKINVNNLNRICDLMNIQISRKNKNIIENSRSNPLMAGFPLLAIEKFIQILMNNGYTVVLIEQVTEPPEPERKVTNIFSPGTSINYISNDETSNLLSIYIEAVNDIKSHKEIICVGLSIIDLTTGKNIIYETFSKTDDINHSLDEIYRFIQSHNPKEIIINVDSCHLDERKIVNYLELNNRIFHFKDSNKIDKNILNLSYQKNLLKKIFKNHGLLSVHEFLDIEKLKFGCISYISLLQFAYEHNDMIINKIDKPEIWNINKFLILTNDSIRQLNLIDNTFNINNKFNSLYGIVNNTSTSIGKRFLKEKLVNPILDINELNRRYQYIENLKHKDENEIHYFKIIEENLNKIVDIERLHRRMSLLLLHPSDFSSLDIAYQNIKNILKNNKVFRTSLKDVLPDDNTIQKFYEFINDYTLLFDMNEISKYHLNKIFGSFFNRGQIKDIDNLQDKIHEIKIDMNELSNKLSNFIEKNSKFIKIEYNDREGYYLQTTKKRGETLKQSFKNMKYSNFKLKNGYEINPKDLDLKFMKDKTKITSEYFNNLSYKLKYNQEKIKNLTTKEYLKKIEYFSNNYIEVLKKICNFIGELDFYKSNAKSSVLFGYNKPFIDESTDQSFLKVKELRHPIIERIQTENEYIPNDVSLGNGEINGMLLYGCNAVGKSSLMKAIGLNIIMAQAGMYVAAKEFIYYPFHNIFTRINDSDNLFKGQSSFAVEMSELRAILNRSSKNSIVLGDELCSGTESISAQSIFASSVIKLSKRNVNFIFATHLHELNKLTLIKDLDNVKSFHLKVIFDTKNKKLIYDRKIEEGSGPAIYGLEVCKAMDLDTDFLKLANSIRRDLLGIDDTLQDTNLSPYNNKVYVGKCLICNENAVDTHHIKEQKDVDENNMFDHVKKNQESNLVPLCKECHYNTHNGTLKINGYIQTSEGIELDYNLINKDELEEKKRKKKNIMILKYRS